MLQRGQNRGKIDGDRREMGLRQTECFLPCCCLEAAKMAVMSNTKEEDLLDRGFVKRLDWALA